MVDKTLLAKAIADVRDAVARIKEVLPAAPDDFARDRTAREVVALNLFVALQQCLSIAAHWLVSCAALFGTSCANSSETS
jgi:hypothetical protein